MVHFLKTFRNYAKGEIAGFSKQHEAWLVEHNIAEKYVPKEAKPNADATKQGSTGATVPAATGNAANNGRPATT